MRRVLVLGAALIALVLVAACAGGSDTNSSHWPRVQKLKDRDITPLPIQHTLEVGDERFSLALQDSEGQLILRANVTFRLYKIDGEKGTLQAEVAGTYVGFDTSVVTEREDGTRETITGPEVGAYVARVKFDEPGDWGAEVSGDIQGKKFDPVRVRFSGWRRASIPFRQSEILLPGLNR